MKPTKRSINAALPRLDSLRRQYMPHGYTGIAHGSTFASAWADLDEAGNVTSIRTYAVGDAMESRHYYGKPGTVDITGPVECIILGDSDRSRVIEQIQTVIFLALNLDVLMGDPIHAKLHAFGRVWWGQWTSLVGDKSPLEIYSMAEVDYDTFHFTRGVLEAIVRDDGKIFMV